MATGNMIRSLSNFFSTIFFLKNGFNHWKSKAADFLISKVYKIFWVVFSPFFANTPVFVLDGGVQYAIVKNMLPFLKSYYLYPLTDDTVKYLKENKVLYSPHILFPKILVSANFLDPETLIYKRYSETFKSLLEIKKIKKIQVYHGVIDKNWTFSDRNKFFDLFLISGRYGYWRLRQLGIPKNKIKIVGYPKLDTYRKNKKIFVEKHQKPTILYAPTWGAIGTLPQMIGKIIELNKQYRIIVKPHEYMEWYYRGILKDSNIQVSDEADITVFFSEADLMISDSSSAMFEFLTTGKPVISLDFNINYTRGPSLNSRLGPEIMFRNLFYRVKDISKLDKQIILALKNKRITEEQKKIVNSIIKPTLAGQNAASEIMKFINHGNDHTHIDKHMNFS